jgi:hypothetical protein
MIPRQPAAGCRNFRGPLLISSFLPRLHPRPHRARCAAAIFLRADADMVRFTGAAPVVFVVARCDPFRAFDHLAFCASAILRRETADTIRVGCPALRDLRDTPDPFNDSITEIA